MRGVAFAISTGLMVSLIGCGQAAGDTEIDQEHLCIVKKWQPENTTQICIPGQKVVFLPSFFGSSQLPIMFVAANCNLRYEIALTEGGVTCIFKPIKDARANTSAEPAQYEDNRTLEPANKRNNELHSEDSATLDAVPKKEKPSNTIPGQGGGTAEHADSRTLPDKNSAAGEQAYREYLHILLGWFAQHRYYPKAAREDKVEGATRLHVVVSRDGHVLISEVAVSSGSDVLDQAALDMVSRSDPAPAFPGEMLKDRLEVLLPVNFALESKGTDSEAAH